MTGDRRSQSGGTGLVLDPERVIAEMECDADAYREIVDVFLQELPVMHASIDAAEASGHVNRVLSALHEIANSLGIVGGTRGESVVRGLEAELYEDPTSVALSEATRIARGCLDECAIALRAWLQCHARDGA